MSLVVVLSQISLLLWLNTEVLQQVRGGGLEAISCHKTCRQSGDSEQEARHSPCNEHTRWTALLHMQQHCEGMQELSDSATM